MQRYLNKFLQIGEKNVEWLALLLGAFFFLYMGWTYWITKPVSRPIKIDSMGTVVVTPATIDETIDTGSAEPLRKIMDVQDEQVPKFVVKDFSDAVSTALGLGWAKPVEITQVWNYQPVQLNNNIVNPQLPAVAVADIKMLPTLPAAVPLFVESGKTTVGGPPAQTPQVPGAPAAPGPPPPIGFVPPVNPAAQGSGLVDIEWSTIVCTIPAEPLVKQWTLAFGPSKPGGQWKLPNGQAITQFLSLTAYRSEKLPDGKWGPDEAVPRLWNNPIPAYPAPDDKLGQLNYLGAIANAGGVATPIFPNMASGACGTIWKDPTVALQTLLLPAPAAPTVPVPPPVAPPPAVPGVPGAPPVLSPALMESTEPTIVKAEAFPPSSMPVPPGGNLNPAGLPPAPLMPGQFAARTTGNAATPPPVPPPADLLIYIHDASMKPGRTYRYRVAYTLANPLYNRPPDNFGKNPQWADKFDLVAPMSAYTPEVTVPLRTYFFCGQPAAPGNSDKLTMQFDVFSWGMGVWNKHPFTVNPGDQVGAVVNGIDFSTGYTYVDQRKHNNQSNQRSIVCLIDSDGTPIIRDAEADFDSPDHKLKNQWVDAQAGQTAGAAVAGAHVVGAPPMPTPQQLQQQQGGPQKPDANAQNPDMPPP